MSFFFKVNLSILQQEYSSLQINKNLDVLIRFSREKFEPGPGFELRICGSNLGQGSNFSLKNIICKFYKAWNL